MSISEYQLLNKVLDKKDYHIITDNFVTKEDFEQATDEFEYIKNDDGYALDGFLLDSSGKDLNEIASQFFFPRGNINIGDKKLKMILPKDITKSKFTTNNKSIEFVDVFDSFAFKTELINLSQK